MAASSGLVKVFYEGGAFSKEGCTEPLQGGMYIVNMGAFSPSSSTERFSVWMVDPKAPEEAFADYFEPLRDTETGEEVAQNFTLRLTVKRFYVPDGWCLVASTNSETPNPLAKIGYTKV